jgi:N-acetyl-gamma-glutamyl-phosphate reductase
MRASSICLLALTASSVSAFGVVQPLASFTTTTALFAKPKVFIDGEAGTTGIQVRDRLAKREDLEIISAPDGLRKDADTRRKLINEADAVILCK